MRRIYIFLNRNQQAVTMKGSTVDQKVEAHDMGVLIADLIIKQLIEKLRLPIDTNNNATES